MAAAVCQRRLCRSDGCVSLLHVFHGRQPRGKWRLLWQLDAEPPLRKRHVFHCNASTLCSLLQQLTGSVNCMLAAQTAFRSGFAGIGPDTVGRRFWDLFWEPGSSQSSGAVGGEAFAERVQHGASFIVEVAGGGIGSDIACLVRFRCGAQRVLTLDSQIQFILEEVAGGGIGSDIACLVRFSVDSGKLF